MTNSTFLELLDRVSSWSELESRIANLPTEHERGEVFEQFCKAFFILDPVFQFKYVYRQKEIPFSLCERLGYPSIQDIGIDGLAVTSDDKLFAYQAKFRTNRNNTPTLRELSTFFTMSDKADWRIVITNANRLPSSIDDRTRQGRVLSDRLDKLDDDFFNRIRLYILEQKIIPPKAITPLRMQKEAIEKALTYFKDNDRGQLILPCGTGKTLTAMWIAEKLGTNKILIMVPSLALLSQTLREWAVNTSFKPFHYLCLCSDTTVDLRDDSPIEHLHEMDIPVTTDVEVVNDFLANQQTGPKILFSTYQSSKVLSEATLKTNFCFDVAIFDEAHRTTGTKAGVWNIALDDKSVPVKKRIFMTATPRIYAPHIMKKAKENDVLLCSMDDELVYGKPFYEMTFGKAIEENLITDYKVIVICVTDSEVREIIQKSGRIITNDEHEWDAKAFAKKVALIKGIKAYGLKKIFTFHGRVNGAKALTDTSTPYGIHQVVETTSPELARQSIKYFHVNGTMPSGVRNSFLQEFREADIGIMSNARCLTEGVDVPAVDTVAFIDPKRSLIDIVQATGRAMRKANWKEKGYIFIPVVIEENKDPERFIENSDFEAVWKVLQAMIDQDHRLQDTVCKLRIMQGKREEGTQAWKDAMNEYSEKIEFFNLPVKIDKTIFLNALYTKTLSIIGKNLDFWYGLTLAYKNKFNDPNAPARYKTPEGYNLGQWQADFRVDYRKGKINKEIINRFDEIGFIWNILEESFETGFRETIEYKIHFGNANAPKDYISDSGYKLGQWQQWLRHQYKKGEIASYRVLRLKEIGFEWRSPHEVSFEKGIEESLRYKNQTGYSNAPADYKTSEGYNLGGWQVRQRQAFKNGKLPQIKIERLDEIGFKWALLDELLDELFVRGFQETLEYKKQTGDSNAPTKYITPSGYKLGIWQSGLRVRYKKGKLSPEEISRLEEIGFKWDNLEDKFSKGLQETLKYKKVFGTSNVPRDYKTADGYNIGTWQTWQRYLYNTNKLPPKRIQQLEEIGFIWNPHEETFQKGVLETKKYKERYGTPNALQGYRTVDGFKLRDWQQHLRLCYRKGQLSSEKIKTLERLEFTWNCRDNKFEKWILAILRYKEQHGTSNVPPEYVTPEGLRLGRWQIQLRTKYRKGKISKDRIKRLEKIAFNWEPLANAFEKGFKETQKYMEIFGIPNAPATFKTEEGYKLGQWQDGLRTRYKRGQLLTDRIKRLEGIGFKWNIIEDVLNEAFEKGFQKTLKFKNINGHPNALAKYVTPDGYKLGSWQVHQRQNYKQGKLSIDKIKRFEEIGFRLTTKSISTKKWGFWYDLTLQYKKDTGNPNCLSKHITPDGYNLGIWQDNQRASYKKGILSSDKIQMLEEIGFEWVRPHK